MLQLTDIFSQISNYYNFQMYNYIATILHTESSDTLNPALKSLQ